MNSPVQESGSLVVQRTILSRSRCSWILLGGLLLLGTYASPQTVPSEATVSVPPPVGVPSAGETIHATEPVITFENGALAISAEGVKLSEILGRIAILTGADIEVPSQAEEPVFVRLGPGPARDVISALLSGSMFNYILVGSSADATALTKVLLLVRPPSEVRSAALIPSRPATTSVAEVEQQPEEGVPQSLSTAEGQQQLLRHQKQATMEAFQRSQNSN